MDLKRFLELTADVPGDRLREAMVRALAAERPGGAYARFYARVLSELGRPEGGKRAAPASSSVPLDPAA